MQKKLAKRYKSCIVATAGRSVTILPLYKWLVGIQRAGHVGLWTVDKGTVSKYISEVEQWLISGK